MRAAVAAGVDAVLVQDLGLLRLIDRLCPELPLHASTQMTLSSAECIREVESLGVRRVVLPRELSIAQIAAIRRQTERRTRSLRPRRALHQLLGPMSGEPVDGRPQRQSRPVRPALPPALRSGLRRRKTDATSGEKKYPLSPHDLAAYDRLPELIAAGVSALKIEGRLKTGRVRRQRDAPLPRGHRRRCGVAGRRRVDNQLRRRQSPRWRPPSPAASATAGSMAPTIARWSPARVRPSGACCWARSAASAASEMRRRVGRPGPPRRRRRVRGRPQRRAAEQGGRVYEIFRDGNAVASRRSRRRTWSSWPSATARSIVGKIRPGQKVWKTDDPRLRGGCARPIAGRPQAPRAAWIWRSKPRWASPLRVRAVAATGARLPVGIAGAVGRGDASIR